MRLALERHYHNFPVFHNLPDKRIQEILENAIYRKYHKGQILFMTEDPRDRIYFSLSGYIKLTEMNEDCSSQFFMYLKPYSMFPYVGLFQDKFYRFSAEAVTDIEVLYIATAKFERLVQNDPIALMNLIKTMGDKMYKHEVRIQKLTQVHASDRVRHLIGFLMQDIGEKTDSAHFFIPCPITTTDLAKMSGTSRETVSHVLQEYKSAGKLEISHKVITIKDPAFFLT
jgi:CRP-like cAMP-binding protein